MRRSARFFRVVWNINGIAILIVALGAVGVLALAAASALFSRRDVYKPDTVNVAEAPDAQAQWAFGAFERVPGTPYLLAPVESKQDWTRSSYSRSYDKEASATRNYLFVSSADRSSHYLLPDSRKMILDLDMLHRRDIEGKPVEWLRCRVVDTDTNGDGRMDEDDGFSLAFANPDGTGFQEVLPNVTSLLGDTRPSRDRQLVFYLQGKRSLVSEIDIPARRVLDTKELPPIPAK